MLIMLHGWTRRKTPTPISGTSAGDGSSCSFHFQNSRHFCRGPTKGCGNKSERTGRPQSRDSLCHGIQMGPTGRIQESRNEQGSAC